MKILIIGSGGMLGHTTTLFLRSQGYSVTDISRTCKINEDTILMNVVSDRRIDKEYLQKYDAIINCAALLNKACDERKADAVLLNSWFPHYLELELKNTGTKIIQVSTDGVFKGDNPPYSEDDYMDTQTYYGRTKILGELDNEKDVTVRASFVGPDLKVQGTGLFNWFVSQKGNVKGFRGVKFNAVTSLEFAEFVTYILKENVSGIYHLCAAETISKSQFLHMVKDKFDLAIEIEDDFTLQTDHTLCASRKVTGYTFKSYEMMLDELKEWMERHRYLYPHYHFL